MRHKIAGVVVAFAVLVGGGLFFALDDSDPAQGADAVSGPTPEDCRPVGNLEMHPC